MTTSPDLRSISLRVSCAFLVLAIACKDAKRDDSRGNTSDSAAASRYTFQAHLTHGKSVFDVYTEGSGSLRTLLVVRADNGFVDTAREEIDGAVMSTACADLDRDSVAEIYVFSQSAGSGSYANLYASQVDQRGRQSFALPELDKRLAAGYLGHDTLWIQDSVLVRRFPVYTEGDFNATASGGTRTLEYILQRNRDGTPYLQCIRVTNTQ